MLKIRDGIDLKELEKFGFKRNKNDYYRCRRNDYYLNISQGVSISIMSDTRWIMLDSIKGFHREHEIVYQNILFDLIQANMVEKVSDE